MRWSFRRDESGQRIAKYHARAIQLDGLRSHLPAMRSTVDELAHSVSNLQMTKGPASMIQSVFGLEALSDLHAAAITDLEQGRDVGAMILAQEGIRVAVDATYVLCDPEGSRVEALIRQQLDVQRVRAADWHRAFPEDPQAEPMLRRLEDLCRRSQWYAQAPAWPSFVSRAEAVSLDSWVHPIFANTSNASEAATQQFIHAVDAERLPEPERSAANTYRVARCLSDTLYVESVALLLFAHVVHQLAINIGDPVAVTVAESGKTRMESIIGEHDRLADAHINDTSVYMSVSSTPP